MPPSRPIAISILCVLAVAAAACAQQRFPPPEFDTPYRMPTTASPPPRAATWEIIDLAALVAALALASWLAVRARSRRGLVVLTIAAVMYFGFFRGGCVCPIGAIQNVAHGLAGGYVVPLAVIGLFVAPLLFALFFGRTFCASVCPLGAAQELLLVKPLRVPMWLGESLGLLAYVYLGGAILFAVTGSAYIICQYDPFVSIFRLVPVGKMVEGLARGQGAPDVAALAGRIDNLLLAAAFVGIGLFVGRPYCRFLCPYGVLLGWMSRASRWRATITPTECVHCRLCEDACPYGAIRAPSPKAASRDRFRGRGALAFSLAMLPVLLVAGGVLGGWLGKGMARAHRVVALADQLRLEDAGKAKQTTEASDAFRATGRPVGELLAEADAIEAGFVARWRWPVRLGAAHLFGAFVGLVIAGKLIGLSIRRRRTDYEPDRAECVACGRCFAHCPVETARRKGTDVVIPPKK